MTKLFGRDNGQYRPIMQRFWSKIIIQENGCWMWVGTVNWGGYAMLWNGSKMIKAHRLAYQEIIGSVPKGMELDHLCRNHWCVNPFHLEAVTHQENMRRGTTGLKTGAKQKAKTHCPKGHLYDSINTYITPLGKRDCRLCRKLSSVAFQGRARNGN